MTEQAARGGSRSARGGTQRTAATGRRRPTGPHPGVLAAVSLGLFLLALLLSGMLSDGKVFVSPFSATDDVVAFYRDNRAAVTVLGMLQFGSAVPLGIYAATTYARQLRLGIRVPGPAISFFGGVGASLMLMFSGMLTWLAGRPEVTGDPGLVQALAFLAFLTGGVGFVTGIGLLVAGLAVPGLVLKFVPRWLAWTGLVLAALSELSFLSLGVEPLQFLLPIGRFGGMLWLIAVGFLLPVNRAAASWSPAGPGVGSSGGAVQPPTP
ncbi:hypothetical protein [Arthrobacter dokdonensis]|uniref:hypothetical protein n=1 Tax=Arthrobacter dokdonellae TaxID=2211210 RepID=UPI001880CA74|nr:hypothetical protein [Arthrobacter dokdonellae]